MTALFKKNGNLMHPIFAFAASISSAFVSAPDLPKNDPNEVTIAYVEQDAETAQEADDEVGVVKTPPAPPKFIQDYEPDPAIWRLKDDDTTVYFFGTIHYLPEGFKWRSPLLEQTMLEVDEIVFESREEEEDKTKEAAIDLIMEEAMEGTSVSSRLSDDARKKWMNLSQLLDMPYEFLDQMHPTLATFMISIIIAEQNGSLPEFGVESVLEREFRRMDKPISAIEDPVEVMSNVLAIDQSLAIATLEKSLSEWDGNALLTFEHDAGDDYWEMEQEWAQGLKDEDAFEEWTSDPLGKALYQVLLVQRNTAWANWVEDRMKRPGKVLIAVGAGHFEGPDAVHTILQQRGYAVERLNPTPPDASNDNEAIEYTAAAISTE